MTLSRGTVLPEATFVRMGKDEPEAVLLSSFTTGRKVVIFALPGAFTGLCTTAHLPSFIRNRDAFAAKGVDEIICIAVNDPFVLGAWGEVTGATAAGICILGDAEGAFTKAVGMDFTYPPHGMIGRSHRYAMLVENGVVTVFQKDESPGVCSLSGGEALLDAI